ncbi:MAG: hypothetical protein U1E65_10920 [Myxococcota bacterium]
MPSPSVIRKLSCTSIATLSLYACSSEPEWCKASSATTAGTALRFADPDVGLVDFWEHPFPGDVRRKNGQLLLQQFPNPTQSETLSSYLSVIGPATGAFSRSTPTYLSFSGPIDTSKLPADPKAAEAETSPVSLVDIDPASPEKGRRFPLSLRWLSQATTYLPANTLIALVPFGVPLRPNGIYALLVTSALTAADGSALSKASVLDRALGGGCTNPTRLEQSFAPLRSYLASAKIDLKSIVGATVFTTQDAVTDLRALADAARKEPTLSVSNFVHQGDRAAEWEIVGEVDMPSFQAGTPPYTLVSDGGAIDPGPDGAYHVTHHEHALVSFSIPKGTPPDAGWPVVLFAHGTGGSHLDAFDKEVGDALAKLGIAVVGYDGVLHGPRDPTGSNPDTNFFNLGNIRAARDNVRQGAIDNVVMTKLITSGITIPSDVLNGDPAAHFDASRVGYLGHSQGGLVGVPFVAVEPSLKTAVFSGTGAILTITLEERKDPVDFQELFRSLLGLPAGEAIDDMHPVLSLIQHFIEPADPIAYGPALLYDAPGDHPPDVLFVEGMNDQYTPPRTHEAVASATRAPLIAPVVRQPVGSDLIGLMPETGPAKENIDTPKGKATAGLVQYPNQTHFPIYESTAANARYTEFLRSGLLDGRAVVIAQ